MEESHGEGKEVWYQQPLSNEEAAYEHNKAVRIENINQNVATSK